MSETDDTDDLLLIPPDFFLVHSEPEPPYYSIVDSLIKQVTNLQERIEDIESTSDVSLADHHKSNNSLNMSQVKQPLTRRFYSHDDLYRQPGNSRSTPQKVHDQIRMNSLPNTPSVRFSPGKNGVQFLSPQKPAVLESSTDTFISNVKTIRRNHNAVRDLRNEFDNVQTPSNRLRCERDVEETIHELERQSERIAIKKPDSRNDIKERINRVKAWQCGDDITSVPDYRAGFRDQLYKGESATTTDLNTTTESSSDTTQLTTRVNDEQLKMANTLEETYKKKKEERLASEQASRADKERSELLHSPLHDNALSVLHMHKKLLESTNAMINDESRIKKRSINTISQDANFLNLADIWAGGQPSPGKLNQKLHEEKLRRQHCEHLIQELHRKNLEQQQKLAVALQVDADKNDAIKQYKDALEVLTLQFDKLSAEKSLWERDMVILKNQHSIELESANQKVAYYEREASKSLNSARSNQEKIETLETRCTDLQKELRRIEAKFQEVEDNYRKERDKNKQLTEIVNQKEIELKENKSVLNNAREEVSHSRKAVEVCQAEFTAMKSECARLEAELRDDRSTILSLNEQKRVLLNDLQTYKTNEKSLKDALEQAKNKMETVKLELRNYYQGQMEIIVETKRKEMQSQLDQERKAHHEEIRRTEHSMAKTAANHIKEISNKCALETKLLEQKHEEEIKLYQMQLSRAQKEIGQLQSKLAHMPEKRAQLAKQLQKVMESQWNEALKVIEASPTSLSVDEQQRYDGATALAPQSSRDLHKKDRDSASDYEETPVTTRASVRQKKDDSEIQKYINMLLNRQPGNPFADPSESRAASLNQQRASWTSGDTDQQYRADRQSSKDRKSGKAPPWK